MEENTTISSESIVKDKSILTINYVLMFAGYIIGITWIIGVILAFIKKGDAENKASRSHFENIITVFWVNLVGIIIGGATLAFVIGWFILIGVFIWTLIRLIKGFLKVNDGRAYIEE
ncbi:MAG: DUF4870 family protein [Campylobacterales bacterium]